MHLKPNNPLILSKKLVFLKDFGVRTKEKQEGRFFSHGR